ncbi:hypothetical protein Wxf_00243 [Wolbachia endosymbiont of Armadillidium vulgare]|nr:hypothetical protein Wxf_00243 [Wolbachia endosymbiont of Armadillidium vulgare]
MSYNFQNIPKSGSSDKLQPKPDENNRVVLFHEGEGNNQSLGWYTEEQIKNNPDLLFLFGDNDDAKYRTDNHNPGGSKQAAITRPAAGPYDRLPSNGGINGNAIGITTTFYNSDKYTLSINEFKVLMDKEFEPIETWVKEGGCVVIPCDNKGKHNLGTGIAGLERKIPGAIDYIQSKVKELVTLGKQPTQNSQDKNLNTLKEELHNTLSRERESYKSCGGLKNYLGKEINDQSHATLREGINDKPEEILTPQEKSKRNNIPLYSALGVGAIVGVVIAYLAGAAALMPHSVAIAVFIVSAAVGTLVGYGIGKFCEEKQKDPDISRFTAVKNIFFGISITEHSKPGLKV